MNKKQTEFKWVFDTYFIIASLLSIALLYVGNLNCYFQTFNPSLIPLLNHLFFVCKYKSITFVLFFHRAIHLFRTFTFVFILFRNIGWFNLSYTQGNPTIKN